MLYNVTTMATTWHICYRGYPSFKTADGCCESVAKGIHFFELFAVP